MSRRVRRSIGLAAGAVLLPGCAQAGATEQGQRIHDLQLLQQRLREHHLPEHVYQWYLDLRRYGSVPHCGFGLGIERSVAWIAGIEHVREAIPFPRLMNRLYP